jgi:CHAT domain-containing protein
MTFLPIRHSEEEGKQVAETIRSRKNFHVVEFYRENASEESIRGMSDPPTILHLSTHGFFCSLDSAQKASYKSNPLLFSGLALAGANGSIRNGGSDNSDDGLLTALEISGLNLSGTDLVTLSACETGMGELVSGEGVFGLRRAFHHAGAGSVLMSLWAIPDKETADLMVSFYRTWLSGRPRQSALRESALAVLNSTRQRSGHSHPYFWAGFVLAGNQD